VRSPDWTKNTNARFVALEYRPRSERTETPPTGKRPVLLVIENAPGELEFYIAPDLGNFVDRSDLAYLEDLFADLPARAQEDGENLYEQLRSLSVGLLVVYAEGSCPADAERLKSIYQQVARRHSSQS